ncbi:MAG TPA: MFS transporter [Solirubrobacteraceae bacterium]|nr:MFS transporter [Solirubrobacteraceae bacterium]
MYSQLLRTPGITAVLLTTVVNRLPLGALALILILRTREMTGSYAAGGVVAAAHALGFATGAPLIGRLIDRRGQTAIVLAGSALVAAALAGFAALGDGAPLWAAIGLAAVAGAAYPPVHACQRAIWNEQLAPKLRHAAYALDAIVFEIVYIAGPLVLVTGIGAWSLRAAAVAAGLFAGAGGVAFALTRLSREWRPHAERSDDRLGALRGIGVRTILAALALFAVGVAAIEIAVAGFTERAGAPHAVGVMLGLWGLGSLVGGVVAGRSRPAADPARRLRRLMLALAAATVPTLLARDLWTMGAAMALAGLFIAPALALAFSMLSDIAPAGTVTEAHSLTGTGFGVGIAAGAAAGGWIVDHVSTTASYGLGAAAMLAAALVVAARIRTLRPAPAATPAPRPPAAPPAPVPVPAPPGSR